jgi:hypothetical protein
MPRSLLLAAVLALPLNAASPAAAQDIVPDQPNQAQPNQTAPPPPPPAICSGPLARPFDGGLDPRIPLDCDSSAYYFGIGRDKDLVMAKSCALIERINHVDKDGSLFTGPGILSMVFANGDGTPRDIDLARRFVCENKEASAEEIEARLKQLDNIEKAPRDTPRFDLCKTAKTGITLGWCASIQLRVNDAKRYDTMVKIVDGETPQAIEAFKKLQAAESAFEEARASKEIDLTGTAEAALTIQEEDRLRAQFVADLKLFNTPTYSQPVTLAVVDSHIADEYAIVRAKGPVIFRGTTLSVSGVDETQALWLKYRDAWRAYEAIVNPTIPGDAIATQLSRERLYHMHKLATTF